MLQDQMKEREKLKDEAYQEYLKEKAAVDSAMNRMIEEDRKEIEIKNDKRKVMYDYMVKSMKSKEESMAKAKEDEKLMMEKIRMYQQEADQREAMLKMKKAEENAAKEEIFAKLNEEELRRRAEKEYIEDLRIDLMTEEIEEAARLKDIENARKREQ